MNEYHSDTTRISKSGLDLIAKSPAHYWQRYLNPDREPETQSTALLIGSAVHMATLEPHRFADEFAVLPQLDRRTKEGKALFEQFTADNEGKSILTQEQMQLVENIAAAVHNHPTASRLILPADGAAEVPLLWTDADTQAPCKCRPDFVNTRLGVLVDLKTTDDASAEGFARSVYKYRYHVQAAMYSDAFHAIHGSHTDFIFIAVEKTAPFAVAIYVLDDAAVNLGRITYKENLQTYMAAKELDLWAAYPENIQPLSLPNYAK